MSRTTIGVASVDAPVWSPAGDEIVYSEDNGGLFIVDRDGSERRPLARGFAARWSPDGRQIAFVRDGEVFVIGADGSGERRLSQHRVDEDENLAVNGWPAWSPDGRRIAFAVQTAGTEEILIVNSDGSKLTRAAEGSSPTWAPK
jgi:TolB protein